MGKSVAGAPTLHVAEPRATYSRAPPLVADASIIAAVFFGESAQAEAAAVLRSRTLHAPHLLDVELASVGLRKLRRDQLPAEVIGRALEAYARLPIERHAIEVGAVLELARHYRLTAYDGAYLWVAGQLGAPLATLDEQLARAARLHLAGR